MRNADRREQLEQPRLPPSGSRYATRTWYQTRRFTAARRAMHHPSRRIGSSRNSPSPYAHPKHARDRISPPLGARTVALATLPRRTRSPNTCASAMRYPFARHGCHSRLLFRTAGLKNLPPSFSSDDRQGSAEPERHANTRNATVPLRCGHRERHPKPATPRSAPAIHARGRKSYKLKPLWRPGLLSDACRANFAAPFANLPARRKRYMA
jgi:hypothetical protein